MEAFLIEVDRTAVDRRRSTTSGPSGEDVGKTCAYGGSFVLGVRRAGECKWMTRDVSVTYKTRAPSESEV